MMNKIIWSIFALFLLSLSLVVAGDLTVDPISGILNGNPGETVGPSTFTIHNDLGSETTITIVSVDLDGLTDPTKKILASQITIVPNSFTIVDGADQEVGVTVNIPLGLPAQFYGGTFTATDGTNDVTFDLTVGVNSVDDLVIETYSTTNPLTIKAQEDEVRTGTFTIENDGSTSITPIFDFVASDFSDGDKDIILTFDAIPETLEPGETSTVTIIADVPNRIDIDTYSGPITVTAGSDTETFDLEIKIQPEICEDGAVGNYLSLTIDEPDNGDEFAPGETIKIEVNVENRHTKDLDVVVEAFLYNVDQDDEIEKVESDSEEVEEDDDRDFELELEIPTEDIDEDDEYVLYIKAYEDGDEDKQCVEEELIIDIEREKHDVIVDSIQITPSVAEPGEFVEATVKIKNLGSSDEDDVYVKLSEPELNWAEESIGVDLQDGNDEDDSKHTFRFTLEVPDDARAKEYSIEASVFFDEGEEVSSNFFTFTVLEGPGGPPEPTEALNIQSVSETGDNIFTVSAVVTNDASDVKTFTVETLASWANPIAAQTVTLGAGESRIVQFLITASEGISAGSYTGSILVREGGALVDSETFDAQVQELEDADGSDITGFSIKNPLEGTGGTVLLIIGNIVLIIIAIFFIKLIFSAGKKKRPIRHQPEKVKL